MKLTIYTAFSLRGVGHYDSVPPGRIAAGSGLVVANNDIDMVVYEDFRSLGRTLAIYAAIETAVRALEIACDYGADELMLHAPSWAVGRYLATKYRKRPRLPHVASKCGEPRS